MGCPMALIISRSEGWLVLSIIRSCMVVSFLGTRVETRESRIAFQLIIQALASENLGRTLFNPCFPGFGLPGRRKIKQVGSLASGSQGFKRSLQFRVFI